MINQLQFRHMYWYGALVVLSFACNKPQEKVIATPDLPKVDYELVMYNQVLDQLVTTRFYNLYLGDFETHDELGIGTRDYETDSSRYRASIRSLQAALELDTARQLTICLRDTLSMGPWFRLLEIFQDVPASEILSPYDKILTRVSNDTVTVRNMVATPMNKYGPKDFHAAAFKIGRPLSQGKCPIGTVGFSNACFNSSKDKAVLYYEFYCGEKCGKGEILYAERINDGWNIKETRRVWIF